MGNADSDTASELQKNTEGVLQTLSLEEAEDVLQVSYANKNLLDFNTSQSCFNAIFVEDIDMRDDQLSPLVIRFMLCCDEEFLFAHILNNETTLKSFSKCAENSTSIDVMSVITRCFNIFLSAEEKHKESMLAFTSFYVKDNVFFTKLVEQLQPLTGNEENIKLTLRIIITVSEQSVALFKYYPTVMSELLAEFLWKHSLSDLPNIEILLLLNTADEQIKDMILNSLLPNRIKQFEILEQSTLKEHSGMYKRATKMFERLTPTNPVLRERFENGNQIMKNLESLNFLEYVVIQSFFDWPDEEFIKKYRQHLLFDEYQFPVLDVIKRIMKECFKFFLQNQSELRIKPYYAVMVLKSDLLIYLLVSLELDMWIESKASTEEDLESLLCLIPVVITELDRLVNRKFPDSSTDSLAETIFGFLHSLTYKSVRKFQKEQIKQARIQMWSHKFNEFDIMLASNVKSYVKHQRLLQLQMGTWVYSTNPLLKETVTPSVYFIILSHNQSELLAREFPLKTQERPIVNQNRIMASELDDQNYSIHTNQTLSIPLKKIAIFEKFVLKSKCNSSSTEGKSRLVSLVNEKYLSQITLKDVNKKDLLHMYLDNKESEFTLFDGLQMISPLNIELHLTQETKNHIESLISIRKNLQMLNLRHVPLPKEDPSEDGKENDDKYYDLDTLKALTTNLYYD